MPYPTGTPVDEAILDNVKTTLEGIATPNYRYTIARVERIRPTGMLEFREFPLLLIGVPTITWRDNVSNRLTGDMRLTIRGVVLDRESGFESVNWLAADVRKALLADTTRGGLACWTRIESQEAALGVEEGGANPSVDLTVLIHFRHLYDDPNTAT
jgi:hypothetical protein